MANFNNPYNNYPYGNIYQPFTYPYGNMNYQGNNNQQINNQQMQQPQMNQNIMQQQTSYLPLTFTSGLVGAKSFIVPPNQTVYLKDSDDGSDLLFEKSADSNGRYTLKAYRLTEIKIDDIGKTVEDNKPIQDFATKQDLKDLQSIFENKMNNLSTLIQKGSKMPKTNEIRKDSDRNEQ